MNYGPIDASLDRAQTRANVWVTVTLKEGKNREIRKVMTHLGLQVSRLIRASYGPFDLGDLPAGSATEVAPDTLKKKVAGLFRSTIATPIRNPELATLSSLDAKFMLLAVRIFAAVREVEKSSRIDSPLRLRYVPMPCG